MEFFGQCFVLHTDVLWQHVCCVVSAGLSPICFGYSEGELKWSRSKVAWVQYWLLRVLPRCARKILSLSGWKSNLHPSIFRWHKTIIACFLYHSAVSTRQTVIWEWLVSEVCSPLD